MKTYKIKDLPPSTEGNMLREIEARGLRFWKKHYPSEQTPIAATVLFLGVADYIAELERKIDAK